MGLISRVSSRTYRKTMGDPSSMNGGAVVAMTGHECVAIASDLRFGMDLKTIGVEFEKVFQMGDNLFMGLGGFITDIQTVKEKVLFRKNLYEQRESRKMTPKVFENMLSNMLYEQRRIRQQKQMEQKRIRNEKQMEQRRIRNEKQKE